MKKISLIAVLLFQVMGAGASEFTVSEPPKNLGEPVNSRFNDFAPALSPDGSSMIFNSNRGGKYQNLYITHFKEGRWTGPELLPGVNSPFNDESPFLSRDGNILIFSSDRDGSIEMAKDEKNQIRVSFDLYWSKKVNGAWTAPRPMPGAVNTVHHEKSPALSADGKSLYYNMWTFGDINRAILVKAELRDGKFINPQPLPAPFNQGYRDLGLIPAEDLGGFFFSSNRPENIGTFDLYFVSYKDGKFGKPANLGDKVNSMEADIYLSRADQRYYITSSREGAHFDIYSSVIFVKGKSFDTRAIYFDFDKASIKSDSFSYLNALTAYLTENKKIRLEIIGHTDLHGAADYNLELSRRRAQSVKDYLVKKGLDPKRFIVSGAGAGRPVKKGTGAGIDELNRRTEFKNID
jgi:outer membrane protein OmpA-like peptidoglycan-associated protein